MSWHLQLNLGTGPDGAFSILANTAFNATLEPPFNPYANDVFFVHGAYLLEDVGVTAYTARLPPRLCDRALVDRAAADLVCCLDGFSIRLGSSTKRVLPCINSCSVPIPSVIELIYWLSIFMHL